MNRLKLLKDWFDSFYQIYQKKTENKVLSIASCEDTQCPVAGSKAFRAAQAHHKHPLDYVIQNKVARLHGSWKSPSNIHKKSGLKTIQHTNN